MRLPCCLPALLVLLLLPRALWADSCVVMGCNGEMCVPRDTVVIQQEGSQTPLSCELPTRPETLCLNQYSVCGKYGPRKNGKRSCGWKNTKPLNACLHGVKLSRDYFAHEQK